MVWVWVWVWGARIPSTAADGQSAEAVVRLRAKGPRMDDQRSAGVWHMASERAYKLEVSPPVHPCILPLLPTSSLSTSILPSLRPVKKFGRG